MSLNIKITGGILLNDDNSLKLWKRQNPNVYGKKTHVIMDFLVLIWVRIWILIFRIFGFGIWIFPKINPNWNLKIQTQSPSF